MATKKNIELKVQEALFVAGEINNTMRRGTHTADQDRRLLQDVERLAAVKHVFTGSGTCNVAVFRMMVNTVNGIAAEDSTLAQDGIDTQEELGQDDEDVRLMKLLARDVRQTLSFQE